MSTENSDVPVNRLLAILSHADASRLFPFLSVDSFEQGRVLAEPGDETEQVYFPHTGMISLLAVMQDGKAVETATIGSEGVVGAMAGLGLHVALTRAVVQTPLIASHIAAAQFRKLVQASDPLRNLVMRANEMLLGQVQMTAACNALHPIQARLARWILQTRDRVDDNLIPLTQELLSEMLGVRRSSVSEVASALQAAGCIRYSRGTIEIVDRKALEGAACECYETIKRQTEMALR
jgi:CRP-like cAMP-binding protein